MVVVLVNIEIMILVRNIDLIIEVLKMVHLSLLQVVLDQHVRIIIMDILIVMMQLIISV